MLRLETLAPAKVNLVLRVGSLRADGYHDIESLLVPLDLADRVAVRVFPGSAGPVTCRCPGRPDLDGPRNLAARAAEAFRRRFGTGDRVDVRLEKRVPVSAGLGGGSSDAAAVLRCLARAYRVRDERALAATGLEVGSDVPFFLGPGAAWARGRGERIRRARLPTLHLVLAWPRDPALAIRAGDAYRWLDGARSGCVAAAAVRPSGPFRAAHVQNDLEAPCFQRYPMLRAIRGVLEAHGATGVIMSGSGPTVFGLFASRRVARAAMTAMTERDRGEAVDAFLVRTLRRQPGVSTWKSPRSASSRSTRRS
jgi:4-diphosphocytidyl-2-C-methyl-D-erythritol kinase